MERTGTFDSDGTCLVSEKCLVESNTYHEKKINEDLTEDKFQLSGFSLEVCGVLYSFTKEREIKVSNFSLEFFSELLQAANSLDVEGFWIEFLYWLKKNWFKIINLQTILGLCDILQARHEVLEVISNDVINLFLEDNKRSIENSELTYDMLLLLVKTKEFWEAVNCKCTYSFTYELFYESVLTWIQKFVAELDYVKTLVTYLRLETITPDFVLSVINRNITSGESKDCYHLLSCINNQYQNINEGFQETILKLQVILTDIENNDLVLQELTGGLNVWTEIFRYRLNFQPQKVATIGEQIFVFGEQEIDVFCKNELQNKRILSHSQCLDIHEVCVHRKEIFIFAKKDDKMALYKLDHESLSFDYQSTCPVDAYVSAVSCDGRIYVVGKAFDSEHEAKGYSVFKFDAFAKEFMSVTFIPKHWMNSGDHMKNITRCETAQLVACQNCLKVVFYDQIVNFQATLYIAEIKYEENNEDEINADKCLVLNAMDKYSSLEMTHGHQEDVLFFWSRNSKNELSVSVYKNGNLDVQQIGFLPKFVNINHMQCSAIDVQFTKFDGNINSKERTTGETVELLETCIASHVIENYEKLVFNLSAAERKEPYPTELKEQSEDKRMETVDFVENKEESFNQYCKIQPKGTEREVANIESLKEKPQTMNYPENVLYVKQEEDGEFTETAMALEIGDQDHAAAKHVAYTDALGINPLSSESCEIVGLCNNVSCMEKSDTPPTVEEEFPPNMRENINTLEMVKSDRVRNNPPDTFVHENNYNVDSSEYYGLLQDGEISQDYRNNPPPSMPKHANSDHCDYSQDALDVNFISYKRESNKFENQLSDEFETNDNLLESDRKAELTGLISVSEETQCEAQRITLKDSCTYRPEQNDETALQNAAKAKVSGNDNTLKGEDQVIKEQMSDYSKEMTGLQKLPHDIMHVEEIVDVQLGDMYQDNNDTLNSAEGLDIPSQSEIHIPSNIPGSNKDRNWDVPISKRLPSVTKPENSSQLSASEGNINNNPSHNTNTERNTHKRKKSRFLKALEGFQTYLT